MYEVHDAVVVEKQKEGNTALTKTPSAGEDQTRRGGDLPIAIILSDLANYNREFAKNTKYALQDDQTQTEKFKRWFEDSEVTNDNGDPLVVYHTTRDSFYTFDRNSLGKGTDENAADVECVKEKHYETKL